MDDYFYFSRVYYNVEGQTKICNFRYDLSKSQFDQLPDIIYEDLLMEQYGLIPYDDDYLISVARTTDRKNLVFNEVSKSFDQTETLSTIKPRITSGFVLGKYHIQNEVDKIYIWQAISRNRNTREYALIEVNKEILETKTTFLVGDFVHFDRTEINYFASNNDALYFYLEDYFNYRYKMAP